MKENEIIPENLERKRSQFTKEGQTIHYEILICPKCKSKQVATVKDKQEVSIWHKCNCCDYSIMQNEWREDKTNSLFNQAIEFFGVDSQIDVCIEECLELALILQQLKRKDKTISPHAIYTEIADVLIMLEQMRLIFGDQNVADQLFIKKNRLKINIDQQKAASDSRED
jgi:ribosomal protein L37AE/L43A